MKYKQVKIVFTQPHHVLNTKLKYRICGIYFDAVWYEKIAVLLLVFCWLFINNIYWPSNAFLQYCKSYSSSWCKAQQIHAIINVQFLYKKIFKSYCDSVCLPLLSFGDVQLAGSMFWPIILRYVYSEEFSCYQNREKSWAWTEKRMTKLWMDVKYKNYS